MGKFIRGTTKKFGMLINFIVACIFSLVWLIRQRLARRCGIVYGSKMITVLLGLWSMVGIQMGSQEQLVWQCARPCSKEAVRSQSLWYLSKFLLKEESWMSELSLFLFLGNRFNILSLNGAGTFCSCEKLVDFFKNIN